VPATDDAPVLIAGGGLVGLSTAMFLAEHDVPSLVIERLRGGSKLPRAAHFHVRTIELFRAVGIEATVIEQSAEEFLPEGAIIAMDDLSGKKLADIIPSLNVGVDDDLTPVRRLFVSQPGLEPILRQKARAAGASVLEGHEVVGVEEDVDGVTLIVRDVDTGEEHTRRGRYVVAAEGAHSTLREHLGIPFDGRGVFSNSLTIYFTADLREQLLGKPLSVIYINNPVFGGFFRVDKACRSGFLVVNTVGDPVANPAAAANAAADTSEERLRELVRVGAGVPDLPVQIDGVARWRASSDVARRYQSGRVLLAGDAAHVMPPNGGFGGNTGIQDAYDVAWKLAYVVNGIADPALLDTYEAERRPVGVLTVEQAYTRYVTRTATYLGATDFQPFVADLEVELGYLYRSAGVSSEDGDRDGVGHADPRATRGRPGSRAPHLWVREDGARRSVLDLFGRHFVLLTGEDGSAWPDVATGAAAAHPGLELEVHVVGGPDLLTEGASFTDRYDVSATGAVLVRPDGFVAWRARADSPAEQAGLAPALAAALGRSA
jgi:putative polyketide hydroxylase